MDKLTKVWRTKTGNFIDTEKSANLVFSYGVELEQGYFITKEQLLDIIANGIIEGQAKSFVCKDIQSKILNDLGVE